MTHRTSSLNTVLTMYVHDFPRKSCRYMSVTFSMFVSLHACKNSIAAELMLIKSVVDKKCYKQFI